MSQIRHRIGCKPRKISENIEMVERRREASHSDESGYFQGFFEQNNRFKMGTYGTEGCWFESSGVYFFCRQWFVSLPSA